MKTLKSVEPVLQQNEWVVRVREKDDALPSLKFERFEGIGARYTLHQAQVYAASIRRDYARPE